MSVVIVTGSWGLAGAETVRQFSRAGHAVAGVDNDLRAYFFGPDASTRWAAERLAEECPGYRHHNADIRDLEALDRIFAEYAGEIAAVVHTAAQPSHDWAAKEPFTDFSVNATGTLNLLETARLRSPEAVFIFTSTNKVYGDTPNLLPLVERETRWEVDPSHPYAEHGIDESMSIDQTKHSLFGASKVAADVLVQEYGRYFGMKTAVFRGGCLTGPGHSGAELHGFLAYLMRCAMTGGQYRIFGYKGKQVRDNIHAADLVRCFLEVVRAPRAGAVYNIGGGRHSNCSMQEAIVLCGEIAGKPMNTVYLDDNRIGDHIWWISDTRRFQRDYPGWRHQYDVRGILEEIHAGLSKPASDASGPLPRNTLLYSVLVPAYNQSKNLPPTLRSLAGALRGEGIPFELLVVNDNSRDDTAAVVEGLCGEIPEIHLVHNTPPGGLGRAVRCGLRHYRGDALAVVMADSSDDPRDVVACYRKLEEGYDAVFGSRFRPGSEVIQYPPVKLYANRLVNKAMQLLFFTRFNDLTNAFKAYRRHVIESISPLQAAHFNITIEMSLSCLIRRYRIAEIPIRWYGRTWGQSNLRLREMGRRYLCTLLMIWFERLLVLDDLMLESRPAAEKDAPEGRD